MFMQTLQTYVTPKSRYAFARSYANVILMLNESGEFLGWLDTDIKFELPFAQRSGTQNLPQPFDTAQYVLGLAKPDSKLSPDKIVEKHEAYVHIWEDLTNISPDYIPILAFLQNAEEKAAAVSEAPQSVLESTHTILFRLYGETKEDFWEREDLAEYWVRRFNDSLEGDHFGQCMVCLRTSVLLSRVHKTKSLKLMNANEPAFESYGWQGAENSPVCADCVASYEKTWMAMSTSTLRFSGAGKDRKTFAFWGLPTQEGEDYKGDVTLYLHQLMKRGNGVAIPDASYFRGLVWEENTARVMINQVYNYDVNEVVNHVRRWFEVMGGERPHSIFSLCRSLVPKADMLSLSDIKKKILPKDEDALIQAALTGAAIPQTILGRLLTRFERNPDLVKSKSAETSAHFVLLKLCLHYSSSLGTGSGLKHDTQQGTQGMNPTQSLADVTHPYFLAGRILACMDRMQYMAVGKVNKTLVDKYYTSFSRDPFKCLIQVKPKYGVHFQSARRKYAGGAYKTNSLLETLWLKIPYEIWSKSSHALLDLGELHRGFIYQRNAFFQGSSEAVPSETSDVGAETSANLE